MKKFRVFATCNIGKQALQHLENQGYEVEVYDQLEPPPKSLILEKVSSGIDALITTLRDEIDEEIFRAGKGNLKVVAQDSVGFDNIDSDVASRYGIPFTNTAQVLTDATAEFAFFILGCVSRKLYPSERLVREKKWKTWHPSLPFLGNEVTGKTVSVIGTGRIGKAFLLKCVGMNVDILGYDPMQDEGFVGSVQRLLDLKFELGLSAQHNSVRYVALEEALQNGDYVSLHVPLDLTSHHLVNERTLKLMKSTAFLINTSRGPVVDEKALCQALKTGQISGAALDVYQQEPLPEDSPLRDPELEDSLRLFHHFASGTTETRLSPDPAVGMAGRCVQGVIDVLEGSYGGDFTKMPYIVNKQAFSTDH